MDWKNGSSPYDGAVQTRGFKMDNESIKLVAGCVAFFVLAIGLYFFQPPQDGQTSVEPAVQLAKPNADIIVSPAALAFVSEVDAPDLKTEPKPMPVLRRETSVVAPVNEVSRNAPELLNLPKLPASQTLAKILRHPLRLSDQVITHRRISDVTIDTLKAFEHSPTLDDPLHAMLVQALEEEQSDAYVDALLNKAAAQGLFEIPDRLVMVSGRMNTRLFLDTLIKNAR